MIGFLANESPWPVHNGGRARMAGLLSVLGQDVCLLVAARRTGATVTPGAVLLPPSGRSRMAALLGTGPRLGRGLLGPAAIAVLRERCRELDALVVSHSYLAAELPDLGVPLVVDLQNLEVDRAGTCGALVGRTETWKARRWEPAVVSRADVCVCVDDGDERTVRAWGGRRVVVVPNVVEVPLSPPSPSDGYALLLGDWTYGPNAEGLAWFFREVLPSLHARVVIAGRGSEQFPQGLGFVDDVSPLYDAAAVAVSPVLRGAGTQLKVVEALARGRLVVTTTYGARSVPAAAVAGVRTAASGREMADMIDSVIAAVATRAAQERALRTADFPRTWREAADPLIRALPEVTRA